MTSSSFFPRLKVKPTRPVASVILYSMLILYTNKNDLEDIMYKIESITPYLSYTADKGFNSLRRHTIDLIVLIIDSSRYENTLNSIIDIINAYPVSVIYLGITPDLFIAPQELHKALYRYIKRLYAYMDLVKSLESLKVDNIDQWGRAEVIRIKNQIREHLSELRKELEIFLDALKVSLDDILRLNSDIYMKIVQILKYEAPP